MIVIPVYMRTCNYKERRDNNVHVDDDIQALLKGDVGKLLNLQNQDPTLQRIRSSLDQNQDNPNAEYFRHTNGIIMRKCQAETEIEKASGGIKLYFHKCTGILL